MKRIEEFRKYYNHTIHPELMRMERLRVRLLRLIFVSFLLLAGLLLYELYINIPALTLSLSLPIGMYLFFLFRRVRQFRLTFKPNIINLILDFIDDGMNYDNDHPLVYRPERFIPQHAFLNSKIFDCEAPTIYQGEDHIAGKVGNMDFEMCELTVQDESKAGSGLQDVFRGVFMQATFPENARGRIIIWPRSRRHRHFRAIREFNWEEGENVDHEIMNDEFRAAYMTYATHSTHVIGILSEPMQQAIVDYRKATGKEIYMSFIDRQIYAAVTEDKDLLEPNLWRSNLSFELIREFFEDIHMLLRIAEDFDQTH